MLELRLCIDVPDLERAVRFYSQTFGLKPSRRYGEEWVEMTGAAQPIDLIAKKPGSLPSPRATQGRDFGRHWTPLHLDFVVDDIEASVRRAEQGGATLERGIQEQ